MFFQIFQEKCRRFSALTLLADSACTLYICNIQDAPLCPFFPFHRVLVEHTPRPLPRRYCEFQ
jgi:hypothetical protein